jgi:hypothetical protein
MMRARAAAGVVVAAMMTMASTGALAALCGAGPGFAGFSDVQDTDSFCNATQWLRNRSITLGCGAGTTYCPGDLVTRAQMALFLNRTGTALTPILVGRQSGMGTGSVIPANQFIPFCETSALDLPSSTFPRKLRARGTISAILSGSEIGMALYRTFNGGPYVNINSQELRIAAPSGDQVLHWSSDTIDVPPGNAVTVAIALINRGAGTLTLATNGRCAIEVDYLNANPASAPFDEQH